MWHRLRKLQFRSPELEDPAVGNFTLLADLLNKLLKHPSSSPLAEVDRVTNILHQDNLVLIDLFRLLGAATQPYSFDIVGRMMIIMIMGNRYDICFSCELSNLRSTNVARQIFPRMREFSKA